MCPKLVGAVFESDNKVVPRSQGAKGSILFEVNWPSYVFEFQACCTRRRIDSLDSHPFANR